MSQVNNYNVPKFEECGRKTDQYKTDEFKCHSREHNTDEFRCWNKPKTGEFHKPKTRDYDSCEFRRLD